jgi:hypothetical protein
MSTFIVMDMVSKDSVQHTIQTPFGDPRHITNGALLLSFLSWWPFLIAVCLHSRTRTASIASVFNGYAYC